MSGRAAARWRVLLVDDSADDADLAMIELRHAGIDAECVRVDSEAALLSALDGPAPRPGLSDVNMHGFYCPPRLAIVRQRAPRPGERRVGAECVSRGRSWADAYKYTKLKIL